LKCRPVDDRGDRLRRAVGFVLLAGVRLIVHGRSFACCVIVFLSDGSFGGDAKDLLRAIAHLCQPAHDEGVAYSQRMVALLIDGLRYGST